MNVSLLRALRLVTRADSDPARQTLFAALMRAHPAVRFVYQLHEILGGTWASALLVSCYGAVAFLGVGLPPHRRARVLSLAEHANARRHVARVASWMAPGEVEPMRTGPALLLRPSAAGALRELVWQRRLPRALRIVRALDTRHGFLVSCRAASAMAWYVRTTTMLRRYGPGAVLVSSDSNPEEIGFLAAARALGIPRVFISHAYPTPLSPPLDFSLSILEGEAAVEARRRKGPVNGTVLLAGVEGESAPIDARRFERPNPVVGIFTSKAIGWETLAAVVDDCRRHLRARRVVIRWHPSMLDRPRLARHVPDLSNVVESPGSAPLADIARHCDWVIADENSNVHLPVLKLGIPTLAVKGLSVYPESRADQYGFVANGIIFPPVKAVRDMRPDVLAAFFSAQWSTRFARYDASYLRPQGAVDEEVRRAIRALIEPAVAAAVAS